MDKSKMENIKSLKEFQSVVHQNTFKIKDREASYNNIEMNSFQDFNNYKNDKK